MKTKTFRFAVAVAISHRIWRSTTLTERWILRPTQLRLKALLCGFTLATFGFAAGASAQVVKNIGVIQPIPSLTTFQTWGGPNEVHNMEGIEVTAHFSSAPSETKNWTGAGFADPGGGVIGDDGDWSLVNLTVPPFHTFASPWTLSYSGGAKGNLVAFEIDGFGKLVSGGGIEGNTAFDTTTPSPGTVDSQQGKDFNVVGNTHDTLATYSDAITLGGPPVGDLYRRLRVDFKGIVETKWQQLPLQELGENVHSDLDWGLLVNGDRQSAVDDFISDGRPITGVRWWGSYFNPEDQPQLDPINNNLVPPIEDGFIISIFESNAIGAPEPGSLLGSYVAPIDAVDISPTALVGWDSHDVWEYVVDFDQTLLEHATALAKPDAFNEEEGVEYWIGIAALNGVLIDPASGTIKENGDEIHSGDWWGWHTTPEVGNDPLFVDDDILVGPVQMKAADWIYGPWNQPDLAHEGRNLSFELLTTNDNIGLDGSLGNDSMSFLADTDTVVGLPEPSTVTLAALALLGLVAYGRRRRRA